MNFGAIANFFDNGFNFEKIKQNCPKFALIYEDNDPAVPLEHGRELAKNLNCQLNIINGFIHMGKVDLNLLSSMISK